MNAPVRARRRLVAGVAAGLLLPWIAPRAQPRRDVDLFTLGVASGWPRPDGVVLWTRLAGAAGEDVVGDAPVDVQWELAEDQAFRTVAARGTERATAEDAHSVHAEVRGLQPARDYFYRFTALGARSRTGRTRTAPAAGSNAPLRFAFASCQQYEQGHYAAYRDMAQQPLDFVLHLGDYIYESSWGVRRVRRHEGGIPTQLAEFRERYALYKRDPHLQAAHARFPWLVTWDDHEVANDYTGDRSPRTFDRAQFAAVRAGAYQAWWEHMPVPKALRPKDGATAIHAQHRMGPLDVLVLDGRQYRSPHACLPGRSAAPLVDCAGRNDPSRSFLGVAQEAWLEERLRSPAPGWTLLAQPTLLAAANRGTADKPGYWMDGWDGYAAARERLLQALARHRPRNVLVASGDVHAFWAADVRPAGSDAIVATEFVGGAITSEGPSEDSVKRMLALNPHLRYGDAAHRGYAMASLGAHRCEVEFRAVDDIADAASPVRTLKRFAVADGRAGVQLA